MNSLTGAQRSHLRGLAHHKKPVVQIGQQGVTEALAASFEEALLAHELIKVKFVDCKDEKRQLADALAERSKSTVIARIGHVAVFFRPHPDPEKRKIRLSD